MIRKISKHIKYNSKIFLVQHLNWLFRAWVHMIINMFVDLVLALTLLYLGLAVSHLIQRISKLFFKTRNNDFSNPVVRRMWAFSQHSQTQTHRRRTIYFHKAHSTDNSAENTLSIVSICETNSSSESSIYQSMGIKPTTFRLWVRCLRNWSTEDLLYSFIYLIKIIHPT